MGRDARHPHVLGHREIVASWLFTIVRNECYRLLEGHRRAPQPLDENAPVVDERPALDDELEARRRAKLLACALEGSIRCIVRSSSSATSRS